MRKDLLGLEGLEKEEIIEILDKADEMKGYLESGKLKHNLADNLSVVNLFYENSTRTRTSFENAAKFIGANLVNVSVATSSVSKGEGMIDTVANLYALKNNVIVMRHSVSGAPHFLATRTQAHVINAGDGMHEHPTQALLDIYTMRERFGRIEGLKVAILGDIKFSRVARSNIHGLATLGAKVRVFGPATLMPQGIEKMGVRVCSNIEEALRDCDVVMGLRIQLERQSAGLFPSVSEYFEYYGITPQRLKLASKDVIVMHPGPVNRGVEMNDSVIDGTQSVILPQVTNGLAVRMGIIKLMSEADKCL